MGEDSKHATDITIHVVTLKHFFKEVFALEFHNYHPTANGYDIQSNTLVIFCSSKYFFYITLLGFIM